jgi:hypothetical protein
MAAEAVFRDGADRPGGLHLAALQREIIDLRCRNLAPTRCRPPSASAGAASAADRQAGAP